MATKKRKKTSSAPVRRRTSSPGKRVKTRRRKKKKGFLSDFSLSSPALTGSVKSSFSGGLGGLTSSLIEHVVVVNGGGAGWVIGANLIGSIVAGWGLSAPNFGAGMAGGAGASIGRSLGLQSLSEPSSLSETEVTWANQMKSLPMFLDEDGDELLSEDYTPGYSTNYGGY
jgi:hypothetical protein